MSTPLYDELSESYPIPEYRKDLMPLEQYLLELKGHIENIYQEIVRRLNYTVTTTPDTSTSAIEVLKPGNVSGQNGNWRIRIDAASGDLLAEYTNGVSWYPADRKQPITG